ncbi:MAG TPA: hypothetical protein PLB21_08380 [Actinomycetota bacterium]|nr:hypothetical protein [Actinomycetota bacterium]
MTTPAHRPLRVTATLRHGIAHASPWTVALDGLLASQLWTHHKHTQPPGPPALEQPDPPDMDLPLARCTADPLWWHWAATCGWPDPVPQDPEIRYWGTRLDHRHAEHTTTGLPQHIHDSKGRWKAYWMPLPVTVALSLTWHAIGDPEAVARLLEPITAIGKKRSQGEGRISSWRVDVVDTLDPFTAAHLSPTGALARPCPAACLTGHPDIIDAGPGYAAVRPPHMHHSRRTDVRLPAPH